VEAEGSTIMLIHRSYSLAFPFLLIGAFSTHLGASITTISDSQLKSDGGNLYTNSLGSVVVTTGGGNANGAGDPSGRNDDGFSGPINLGFTLNFFGTNYTTFWVNNNGNVSFGNGIAAYTPSGPTGASQPIISPFFADVDTRNPSSGVVHLSTLANEDVITWDSVGYFDSAADKLDTFQLILRGPGYAIPTGQGQVGFFYGAMQWETGDASGGTDGFGGTPAAVGFGDGSGNGEVLEGSVQNGISSIVNDEYIWFNLSSSGVPVVPPPPSGVPEPASVGFLLTGAGVLLFASRKYRAASR
jgi:hypothetical protein